MGGDEGEGTARLMQRGRRALRLVDVAALLLVAPAPEGTGVPAEPRRVEIPAQEQRHLALLYRRSDPRGLGRAARDHPEVRPVRRAGGPPQLLLPASGA